MYDGDKLLPNNGVAFRTRMRNRDDLLEQEFAVRVIREIDKCEPAGHREVRTKDGRYISLNELAGGTKGLLLMAYAPELRPYYYRGGGFGDNCIPFMLEIAETVDIKLAVSHLMLMPDYAEVYIENNNKIVRGSLEFGREYGAICYAPDDEGGEEQ